MEITEALTALRADPDRTGVFVDYDGTLAPIVLDPEAAEPHPRAVAALEALAERYARVVVVSGRPVAFLAQHLPESIEAVGLYGLEARRGGPVEEHPVAAEWRPVVDEAGLRAAELPPTVEVEHKGLSLTLHVRRHPEAAGAAQAWAESVAASTGLVLRPAKHSIELHPPVEVDKGTVVGELLAELTTACFVGDDVGDLTAFAALARYAGTGLRVAVRTEESPPELLAQADVTLDGPDGVISFLEALVAP